MKYHDLISLPWAESSYLLVSTLLRGVRTSKLLIAPPCTWTKSLTKEMILGMGPNLTLATPCEVSGKHSLALGKILLATFEQCAQGGKDLQLLIVLL